MFTKGEFKNRTDKFLISSIKKGQIVIPIGSKPVEDAALFLFDDLTPLGIKIPNNFLEALAEKNNPLKILNGEELAYRIVGKLPIRDKLSMMSGGGVLSYLFLKRAGYKGEANKVIETKRVYRKGVPYCSSESKFEEKPEITIDDIIASGRTISTVIKEANTVDLELICLIASSNIDKGGSKYRSRENSTIKGANKLYCAQMVNGLPNRCTKNQKPWILSMRYLITKGIDKDYESYILKKFEEKTALKIKEEALKINREPIDYLRRDPWGFIGRYS